MLQLKNPASGELIQEISEDELPVIREKFDAAKKAQADWARTALSTRLGVLQKFRALILEDKETLAKTLTLEVGKPISQSRNELSGLIARLDFFLENTAFVLGDERVFMDGGNRLEERISHEALGVIGNISAWNYPYFVGSNVFVPALLGGNAVLYKPSEFASLSGIAIAKLLHNAGIPKDVFALLLGGPATGSQLLAQPLDGVFFTGSYKTGLSVAEMASKRMMKLQLELGGKDPVYVCEDVDIKTAAASLADGAFYNNGQSCCSVERIYVNAKIYDAFVEAFVAEVKAFVMGDPMDEATYLGPLTRPAQLQVLEKQVADAIAKGGILKCGGSRVKRPGNYFEATVVSGASHAMDLMLEESFGPLIGIQKVQDDAEALRLMNDTVYGLTAGVYSKDSARAHSILSELHSGSVYWNCCDRVSPRLPWSGRGHSGLGTVLSKQGILTFVQPKAWHLKGPATGV
jgi:acyl-CoA reductase-like NAD-dependent aldehyde dehydrogenase